MIARGASPTVRDRAWFYLAKIRYQRGYLPEAEEALAKVEGKLPRELEEERGLLLANLLMARADYAGAARRAERPAAEGHRRALRPLQPRHRPAQVGQRQARHRAARRGRQGLGARTRNTGACATAPTSPSASRRSRRAGRRKRGSTSSACACRACSRARRCSASAGPPTRSKDPKLALVPWTELAQRDFGDIAVLEAQIAVPYAYAELGAYGQALAALRRRRSPPSSARAPTSATRSRRSATATLIDTLVEQNPGEEMGWFWKISDLRRHAARAPPRAGARPARVPGGDEELSRPALPEQEPRGLARQAERLRRHAGDPPQGLRRAPAGGQGTAAADRHRGARQAARGGGRRGRRPARRPATAWPSPTPSSSSCSSG